MAVFRRETEAGPAGLSARLRGGVGSTFLREQWIYPTLLGQRERLPRMQTIRGKRMSGVHAPAWEGYVVCDEIMHMFATSGVYIQISPRPPPFMIIGIQGYAAALKITLSQGWFKCK
jgi:hypothetical protein